MFDTRWYLATYPDVAKSGSNPLDHYLLHGAREGRNPGPGFDSQFYLRTNRDIAASGRNPLEHYLHFGRAEDRTPLPRDPAPPPVAPTTRPRAKVTSTAPHGVVVHLYYTELWPEVRHYLDNFDELQLFVTLTTDAPAEIERQIAADYAGAVVRRYPNRGRDVAPFVELLNAGAFDGCEIVCKLHSKRSFQLAHGDEWRRDLFDSLIGSPSQISEITAMFREDPTLGVTAPSGAIVKFSKWGNERGRVMALCRRMGGSAGVDDSTFYSGTMFWFRPTALQALRGLELKQSDFEQEAGQNGGTLQHAIEGALVHAARASGYEVKPFPSGRIHIF